MAAKEIIATGLLSLALLSGCGEDKPPEASKADAAIPIIEALKADAATPAVEAPKADAATPVAEAPKAKETAALNKVMLGLGWDARETEGEAFNLDVCAFLVKSDGKVRSDSDFCFYNKVASDDFVQHAGDNTTGVGDWDDETVKVELSKVPADVDKVVFAVILRDGETRRQKFGQVSNAYIRVINEVDRAELARYDLSEDAFSETGMIFGELYRAGNDWKFKGNGQGFAGGLATLVDTYFKSQGNQ